MIRRHLEEYLKKQANKYPIITITGPRQSGKTTLVKYVFSTYKYVSLEDPDQRNFAEEDPRGFLAEYAEHVIFDEVQRVPNLFSYLQTAVDEKPRNGRFILTGSQQFLLNKNISQSLAGRTAILRLLPFSLSEILGKKPQLYWQGGEPVKFSKPSQTLFATIYKGFYPRIYDKKLDPKQWYRDYFETYVTRDIRTILNIGDLRTFEQFLRLLAGRSGQLLNLTSLSNDCGVSHTTIKRWLSVLEASYLILLLPPYYRNYRKRIVKTPKVYFLDPGLLCFLLRITSPKDLAIHPQLGNIFETFVVSEVYKSFTHQGLEPPLYFWRDRTGNEIDLLIDYGEKAFPLEIKAAKTIFLEHLRRLKYWLNLPGNRQTQGALVYGGELFQKRGEIQILPWFGVG